MENSETGYSDFIDEEAVRMQMNDIEETIALHEEAFFGKPRGRVYENYDFDNSQVMKNFRESEEMERKHRRKKLRLK